MFFPFYLLPHYRTVGVKCQHEIIRCLKAFMNNKVNCFCNWFSSYLFKDLVFYAVLIGELSSCFYCNETIDSETILLSQRQTSVITSQENPIIYQYHYLSHTSLFRLLLPLPPFM